MSALKSQCCEAKLCFGELCRMVMIHANPYRAGNITQRSQGSRFAKEHRKLHQPIYVFV